MRIIISGCVAFVIWCVISAWLYNDKLLPVLKVPVAVPTITEPVSHEADSLMKLKASMPADLLIYFEFNNSEFKADPPTDNSITTFIAWLDKYPGSTLLVKGHTDLVGTIEYNQELGLKRAQVIGKYLQEKGIDAGRIIIESKGETEPMATYLTDEGRAKNRRTVVSVKM